MESEIIIKASLEEMENFFDNSPDCVSVRYYKEIESGLFEARIRHAERKSYLRGEYTIPAILKKLNGKG